MLVYPHKKRHRYNMIETFVSIYGFFSVCFWLPTWGAAGIRHQFLLIDRIRLAGEVIFAEHVLLFER